MPEDTSPADGTPPRLTDALPADTPPDPARQPAAEEPDAEKPVAEEPAAEEPVAEEPVAEEPVEASLPDTQVTGPPVAEAPVAPEPTAGSGGAGEPATLEPPATTNATPEPVRLPGRRRGHLPLEALLATGLVFLIIWALKLLPLNLHALDPVHEILRDYSYTDVYYSKINPEASADTNIVLVNIGRRNRAELARLVQAVGRTQPRVIGLDAYFQARPDSAGTARLAAVLAAQRGRLVTGELLEEVVPAHHAATQWQLTPDTVPGLSAGLRGYVNLVGDNQRTTTIRHVRPFLTVAGHPHTSWATQILRLADSTAFAALQKRPYAEEVIRYRGNYNRFKTLDGDSLLTGKKSTAQLRGKLVLLGFLGDTIGSDNQLEDLRFTPLNEQQLGRSLPDMYGCVIQANILSMMLDQRYIKPASHWLTLLLAFCYCYLHVALFMYLQVNHVLWYHVVSRVVQALSAYLLVFFILQLYEGARIEVDVVLALLAVVLAVDALYLYELLAILLSRWLGRRSYVVHEPSAAH